jgi:hypothetical protein
MMQSRDAGRRGSIARASRVTAAAWLAVLTVTAAHAQSGAEPPREGQARATGQVPLVRALPPAAPAARPRLTRWLEVQALSGDLRTRSMEDSAGATSHTLQYRPVVRARLKADRDGRLSVHLGAFSGGSFTGGWNHSGAGPSRYDGAFALKQLFVAAVPVTGFETQFGSFGPLERENTEITAWDNDAYFTGARVVVTKPRWLYFDQVAVTRAFVGDFHTPSVFRRLDRFDDANVWSVLVGKRLGPASVSGTYLRDRGTDLLLQGLTLRTPALRVVDALRVEQYVRLAPQPDMGFAIQAERAITPRWKVGGGWAEIDPRRGGLNGDRYDKGRRLISTGGLRLTRELTLSWFYTLAVANAYSVANRQRAEVILSYDAVPLLVRRKLQ